MKFILSRKKKEDYSDEEIIAGYRKDHHNRWIDLLFNRYSHLAFAVAFNYLIDEEEGRDTVMEIFQKLPDDLKRYEIRQFHSWLHRVVRNKCLRKISKKIHAEPAIENLNMECAAVEDPFERYLEHLQEAIAELKDEQRKSIQLFYLEKKSYQEVCEITGYEMNQVKSYIQNGKRNLRILLEKYHHDE